MRLDDAWSSLPGHWIRRREWDDVYMLRVRRGQRQVQTSEGYYTCSGYYEFYVTRYHNDYMIIMMDLLQR